MKSEGKLNNTFVQIKKRAIKRENTHYISIPKMYIDLGFIDPKDVEIYVKFDIDKIKAFCCDLVRNQSKIDAVLHSALARLAEQEARNNSE